MKNGALDFLEKPVTPQRVIEVVQRAVEISLEKQNTRASRARTERLLAALTPRERQVLDRIAQGEINKAVAKNLGISEKTVEVHRARVMSKLNAKSLADLMRVVRGVSSTAPAVAEAEAKVVPLRPAARGQSRR
jgi:FixJ family two-component response regulator